MIVILGAGKFGQAISKQISKKHDIVDVEPDGTYSAVTVDKIKQADYLVVCVPSAYLESCVAMISGIIKKDAKLLSCVKGLYEELKTPTEKIQEKLDNPIAALCGPNLSVEIEAGIPTMTTVAGEYAQEWIDILRNDKFRVVKQEDRIGTEFGGAIKNIAALGAGMFHGYYQNNTKNVMGSFIAFALIDVEHLYQHKSSNPLPQLGFISDLIATCMSDTSRNHKFGHEFGVALREGKERPKPQDTVEGYRTMQIVKEYMEQHKFNLPTIDALYNILFKEGKIEDLVKSWS